MSAPRSHVRTGDGNRPSIRAVFQIKDLARCPTASFTGPAKILHTYSIIHTGRLTGILDFSSRYRTTSLPNSRKQPRLRRQFRLERRHLTGRVKIRAKATCPITRLTGGLACPCPRIADGCVARFRTSHVLIPAVPECGRRRKSCYVNPSDSYWSPQFFAGAALTESPITRRRLSGQGLQTSGLLLPISFL